MTKRQFGNDYAYTEKKRLSPYSSHQMFELVNNIEDYPRFLPWCHTSRIISRTDKEVVATLEANWKGIHKSFTTRNCLFPFERIEMTLVNGPLHRLDGVWTFDALAEHACKMTLDLEFEFTGHFVDRLFQPIFQHIANTFVEAFSKRAQDLYGTE